MRVFFLFQHGPTCLKHMRRACSKVMLSRLASWPHCLPLKNSVKNTQPRSPTNLTGSTTALSTTPETKDTEAS